MNGDFSALLRIQFEKAKCHKRIKEDDFWIHIIAFSEVILFVIEKTKLWDQQALKNDDDCHKNNQNKHKLTKSKVKK